ncbi:MAG: hypothetical protein WBN22_03955 [Verrucomicrobiia bacterium]
MPTSFRNSVRRDADRRARDARAPHFTRELEQPHPDNRHVKDKIRQRLQVLRDADSFGFSASLRPGVKTCRARPLASAVDPEVFLSPRPQSSR